METIEVLSKRIQWTISLYVNPPTELPLVHLLHKAALGMFALIALLVMCTPMKTHRRRWEDMKKGWRDLIGPHALFFKWNVGISAGLFILSRLCEWAGSWFDWPQMVDFGNNCKFFGVLSMLGFLYLLKSKAEAQENQRIGEALFGPRTVMNTNIGALHNYGGNVALGNKGSQINQTAFGNAVTLHQHIHSLIESVGKVGDVLTEPQKADATKELNTLADQAIRPPAQREESKIIDALKVLPGLMSSVATLAQDWDKLEPWIRAHFGI